MFDDVSSDENSSVQAENRFKLKTEQSQIQDDDLSSGVKKILS